VISVMLVDDHPVVIEGLRKLLEAAGDIDVTATAHDASHAIEQARTYRPDVILLDLRMPGATGSRPPAAFGTGVSRCRHPAHVLWRQGVRSPGAGSRCRRLPAEVHSR
jgi:DNA-binding NarL/FixJ family response regulator